MAFEPESGLGADQSLISRGGPPAQCNAVETDRTVAVAAVGAGRIGDHPAAQHDFFAADSGQSRQVDAPAAAGLGDAEVADFDFMLQRQLKKGGCSRQQECAGESENRQDGFHASFSFTMVGDCCS
ncbi:hypothetical protein SDC9_127363 [bioreactor metagenome]|uniref:Uncharacterized protein n=1 Tax=bioreactor metagenome TaxID=1076179 RepID=A0A645CT80_9ZZZZ